MSKKLVGKAKAKARKKNTPQNSTKKLAYSDPNVADFQKVLETARAHNIAVIANFTHLTPTSIILNTPSHYKAIYKDNYGSYPFEVIKAKDGTFSVISDGRQLYCGLSQSRLVWEFENQLAAMVKKVACLSQQMEAA